MSDADDTDRVVRRFVDAFNAHDLDALVSTLTRDVEVQTSRGVIEGRDEVQRWAERKPGGYLHQRLVLEDVSQHGAYAVATMRRQWAWREDGEVADDQKLYFVATLRDGLICRWQSFEDRDEALRAAGSSARGQ